MKAPSLAAVLMVGLFASPPAHAADILVTVTTQRVTGGPGCSLQEAIYSANYDANVSVVGLDTNGRVEFRSTNCVPGSGADRIILPFRAWFGLSKAIADPMNPFGPSGTPMVATTVAFTTASTSRIDIEGNGSTIVSTSSTSLRAFAVDWSGHLTLTNLFIRSFSVKGGRGASAEPNYAIGGGGGGGMGAGGAAFVRGGTLIVRNTTMASNSVEGGRGGGGHLGGGGGGLSGSGGIGNDYAGGGGGGSRGDGQRANGGGGGAGGGTVSGPLLCGGDGGHIDQSEYSPLQDGQCEGGGGGGGASALNVFDVGRAGDGAYGGGGAGAGAYDRGDGGRGGFGGGGGAANRGGYTSGDNGGDGGFGGGGGSRIWNGSFSDPGQGGMFGGDAAADGFAGGGGAGLGGAIFSDGGVVVLENSTLAFNTATRGEGGIYNGFAYGQYGEGRGGAVFAFGGRVILRNTTIAGNRASSSDSGIVVYKQSVLPDHVLTLDAELDVANSIIANNTVETSLDEPQCRGVGFVPVGVGNLIHNETNCAGVVRTGDPLLGPLSYNAPGNTPTLAITSNASEAFNTADSGTSLLFDQRGMPRPKQGGFDIGAYERCVSRPEVGITCTLPIFEIPETVMLWTSASPATGGSVSPATGAVPKNSVQQLVATPAPGWMFDGWAFGPLGGSPIGDTRSASTFIGMDTSYAVEAQFVTWTARPAGRATPGSTTAPPRVDLTWLGTGGADHYSVSRATVSGGPYVVVGISTTTAFSDRTAGLTNGVTYYYIVEAVAADGTVVGRSSEGVVKIPLGR